MVTTEDIQHLLKRLVDCLNITSFSLIFPYAFFYLAYINLIKYHKLLLCMSLKNLKSSKAFCFN